MQCSKFLNLAAALLLCGAATVQAAEPQAGGVLKVALDGDPQCLDPQQAGNNTALNIGRQITDSLTDQDPRTGAIVPWLATRWAVEDDSRRFTFVLREGVSFADGTPVDADAVKANFEAIVKMGARSSLASTYLAGLENVQTPDAHTVVVRFKQANAQFLQATSTMSMGLLSKATLAKSYDERCQGQLIGSGPFVLQSFVHNQSAKLARRNDYGWASSLAGHSGRAYLDAIEFRVIAESGVRTGSLISRQIDVNTSVLPQDEKVLQAQGLPILARSNPGLVYSFYPQESLPIGGDIAVRRALVKGINRPELQTILSQYQRAATSLLAQTTPLYIDHSADLAYDPEGAAKLLDDAGWKPGADGIRVKDGKRLAIALEYWQSVTYLELVQQQLRAIGIDLQLKKSVIGQVNAKRDSGQLALQFYNLTRADPDILRTVFLASGRNVNFRQPAEVDDVLARSAGTLDTDTRRKLVDRAVTLLLRDGHAIPLVELATVGATGKNVHGLHYEASSRLQFFDTWIEK
ncbi:MULTISPECIES: ABC transporter substrate-binding protein [unclassified Achromobacter]|uniref:ABC transporter substrate-binding protein n=1 Tax=unclassified Achromobacter TaxID=2626865 RepID=UPI000B515C44|nr:MULTISPECIES: ABC transporter substrate-binding protein [unclassified Achromobacter]OWT72821.1 ABC transporter substrate-binding protein [Achromobacter sp. HZ34]OWT74040.1 ABC transporter substrate-binding protein [Achromobacter sp. HZ28]